jgi:small subunit ribosomal protein S1
VLHIGQEVEVQVLSVDKEKKKIALSIKRAEVDPWTTVEQRYSPGQVVTGVVTKTAPFGAFARIEDGIEGLIHHSELSPGTDAKSVLHEGAQLQLRILRIDAERRRLGLSLRQTEEEEATAATAEITASSTSSVIHGDTSAPTTREEPTKTDTPTPSTKRESKSERRERAERSTENSILGNLRTGSDGELTAMAEAFRTATRQRSPKDENDSSH